MVRETGVQSHVESYQRLKKWYLMPPCLILSIIRIKWNNLRNGVAPSSMPQCCSYWKGSLWVTLFTYFYTNKEHHKSLSYSDDLYWMANIYVKKKQLFFSFFPLLHGVWSWSTYWVLLLLTVNTNYFKKSSLLLFS